MTKQKTMRLKKIHCVYEPIKVCDVVADYLGKGQIVSSPEQVSEILNFLRQESKEHFWTIHLDTKKQIICLDQISVGSLSASIVHPREVFKSALLSSASSMLVIHNHPSGNITPSKEDIEITERLQKAGDLLGITVLDHLILGEGYFSFADHQMM